MIIRVPMRFEGSKGEKHLYALFDSGATHSCISEQHAAELGMFHYLPTPLHPETADTGAFLEVRNKSILDFYHEDCRMSDEFLVVPGLSEEVIIGAYTMQKFRIKLDFEDDKVIIDPRAARPPILINLIARTKNPDAPRV